MRGLVQRSCSLAHPECVAASSIFWFFVFFLWIRKVLDTFGYGVKTFTQKKPRVKRCLEKPFAFFVLATLLFSCGLVVEAFVLQRLNNRSNFDIVTHFFQPCILQGCPWLRCGIKKYIHLFFRQGSARAIVKWLPHWKVLGSLLGSTPYFMCHLFQVIDFFRLKRTTFSGVFVSVRIFSPFHVPRFESKQRIWRLSSVSVSQRLFFSTSGSSTFSRLNSNAVFFRYRFVSEMS